MTKDRKRPFFNADARDKMLQQMEKEELDVLIIGGGITGCGILLDTRLRGLQVGLVEMQDFGAGTSSRSTKLIHGGLRYLKQGELRLVREVGQERAILHQNAPHLVIPERMLLPIYKGGSLGKWSTSLGLWIYDLLANVKINERRKMLDVEATLEKEPLLHKSGLLGSGLYIEYRTDDARLTLEVAKTAVGEGALAANYAKVDSFIYEHGKVKGVELIDLHRNKTYIIKAKSIVNATGPWVDQLREKDNSLYGKRLHLSKGIHIVIDSSRFPLQQAIYFDTSDRRMIFAIPRQGKTYIGTTDSSYKGELREPTIAESEIIYLLAACNQTFPSLNLVRDDIEATWAGIRPLIEEGGKSSEQLSRRDELIVSPSGLITIAGGKLTGYRKMAEKVTNLIMKEYFPELWVTNNTHQNATASTSLIGGRVGASTGWQKYKQDKLILLEKAGLSRERAIQLLERYGSETMHLMSYMEKASSWSNENVGSFEMDTPFNRNDLSVIAEVFFSIEEEMVLHKEDFLSRRTSMNYFEKRKSQYWSSTIDQIMERIKA